MDSAELSPSQAEAIFAWWDSESAGRLVLAPGKKVVASNTRARSILLEGDAVFQDGDTFRCRLEEEDQLASRFLKRRWRIPTLFCVRSVSGQAPILLETMSISSPQMSGMLAIACWRSKPKSVMRAAHLCRLYDLTKAERRIAGCLLIGKSAEEIAERWEIALDTSRTHIRNIYRKFGVSSRGELQKIILKYIP